MSNLTAGVTKRTFDKNVARLRADGKSKREAVERAMKWHKKQGGTLVDLGELGKAKRRSISRLEQVASVKTEVDKSGVVPKQAGPEGQTLPRHDHQLHRPFGL